MAVTARISRAEFPRRVRPAAGYLAVGHPTIPPILFPDLATDQLTKSSGSVQVKQLRDIQTEPVSGAFGRLFRRCGASWK